MSLNPWRRWAEYRRRRDVADEARVAAALARRTGSGMTVVQISIRTGLGPDRLARALDRMGATGAVLWEWDDWRHPRQKFLRLGARADTAGG